MQPQRMQNSFNNINSFKPYTYLFIIYEELVNDLGAHVLTCSNGFPNMDL